MNTFTGFFLQNFSKYSPKHTIFKKISRGSMPPNIRVAKPRTANAPTFTKIF